MFIVETLLLGIRKHSGLQLRDGVCIFDCVCKSFDNFERVKFVHTCRKNLSAVIVPGRREQSES